MTKPTDSARLHGAITSSDQEDQWSFANRPIQALKCGQALEYQAMNIMTT